jgi:tetratricopeptide (TPR) repeat protein
MISMNLRGKLLILIALALLITSIGLVYGKTWIGNWYSRQGRQEWYKKNYEGAQGLFSKSLEYRDSTVDTTILFQIFVSQGQFDEGSTLLEELSRKYPRNFARMVMLSDLYYLQKACLKSRTWAEKAALESPKDAQGWRAVGSSYFCEQDFEKAGEFYQMAIDLDPQLAPALNGLAIVLLSTPPFGERLEEAIDLWDRAIAADPTFTKPYINAGQEIRIFTNNYRRTIDYFEQFFVYKDKDLAIDPDTYEAQVLKAYFNLGLSYSKLNEYVKACPNLKEFFSMLDSDTTLKSSTLLAPFFSNSASEANLNELRGIYQSQCVG